MLAVVILCTAIFGVHATAVAPQADVQLVSQGEFCFNVTTSPWAATDTNAPRGQRGTCTRYAVLLDLMSYAGWYARVFHEGPFITMIYPDAANPSVLYTVQYNTQYRHWRTRGPNLDNWGLQGVDDTRNWSATKAGMIVLDAPAPPNVLSQGILGNWKQTYRSFGGSDTDWEEVRDHYQRIAFDILTVDPQPLGDLDFFRQVRDQLLAPDRRQTNMPALAGYPTWDESGALQEMALGELRERRSIAEGGPAEGGPCNDDCCIKCDQRCRALGHEGGVHRGNVCPFGWEVEDRWCRCF